MISLKLINKKLFAGILTLALVSCSDPWSDRENNGDDNLNITLTEAIANTPETSKFAELLAQSGYDEILAGSKTYTVFVPTNDAMAQVDASLLNTPEKVTAFVQNHITLTAYSSVRDNASEKIKMLGPKYLLFKGTATIGDATILTSDKYAKNGVFHIINKSLAPKKNIWEYINSQTASSAMSNYLVSLNELNIYDSDITAKENAIPGALADSLSNSFLKNVYNVNNEKNTYTLFLMEDDGYSTEVDKLKPYLNKSTADLTATYSRYFTVRDMVFPKAYMPNELPNELTTRFGVKVTIDKTQIIGDPIVLSNGVVYRMKKVDVPLKDRLVTTKIEGENNVSFSPSNLRSKIFYREQKDLNDIFFKDVMVYNSGVSLFQLNYRATDLFSITYKVYWRAVNINNYSSNATVFQQRLAVGRVFRDGIEYPNEVIKDFGLKNVEIGVYDDVYLGEFTLTNAQDIDRITLYGANTTTVGNNTMILDYLKFVPDVK
ncbi:fasciclin domain-containing protein [Flavobacterium ajazii]|uniref:fasciclin domain-containing protein n=1 Tax=Flavobacterium ajazii TaxID=2692318 RepID=UPI0013D01959|nr:fasciclin domain-containing protein [Flavobacterium ajazii]